MQTESISAEKYKKYREVHKTITVYNEKRRIQLEL